MIGHRAVELLVDILRGVYDVFEQVTLRHELVVKNSTTTPQL